MVRIIKSIPSKEINDSIGKKVEEDKDVEHIRSKSFLLLKQLIESRYKEEIDLNTALSCSGSKDFLDASFGKDFLKGYIAGNHAGIMSILKYIDGYIQIMETDIIPLLNAKYLQHYDELQKETESS